jgi:hypothetical protein
MVLALNAPWFLAPIYVIKRMYSTETPFTEST